MVNTLKKVVLGALLGATVTVALGAVDTFAADRWDAVSDKWEEAREQMVENYKTDLAEAIAEEKAAREAVRDEEQYKYWIHEKLNKEVVFSELYVKAVAEQSRGLDIDSIKEALEFAGEWREDGKWVYDFDNNFKTEAEKRAFFRSFFPQSEEEYAADPEKWEKKFQEYSDLFKDEPIVDLRKRNFEAYKKAYMAVWPSDHYWWEDVSN